MGGEGGVGGDANAFCPYLGTVQVLPWYTQDIFSPRERFLTHQCNISENIKSNEYRDETTMGTRQQEIVKY